MTLDIRNLAFFDKDGNRITTEIAFDKDSKPFHKFHLNFNSVSKKLFETQQLYIFEEVLKQYEPHETEYLIEPKSRFVPKLIQFLQTIIELKRPATEKDVKFLFRKNDNLYVDEIKEFATEHSTFITRYVLPDGTIEYNITKQGYDLYENATLENEYNGLLAEGLKLEFSHPMQNVIPSEGEQSYFYFQWTNPDNDKNMFIYNIDYSNLVDYTSNKNALSFIEDKFYPALVPFYDKDLRADSEINPDWRKTYEHFQLETNTHHGKLLNNKFGTHTIIGKGENYNSNPFQLNLALTGDDSTIVRRILEIFVVTKKKDYVNSQINNPVYTYTLEKISEITCEGEIIGEDVRFSTFLTNLNRTFDENYSYVYSNADIDEDNIDYKLVNQKRKEMLISGDEIFNYLGSYKSFVNVIKHFGYNDIRIQEYFYDVVESKPEKKKIKYSSINIPTDLKNSEEFKNNSNEKYQEFLFGKLRESFTKKFKKTARFGLIYDINKFSGKYDSFGFPMTEDVSLFTFEEIIIKLYGLKKVLEEYYLPHHARIIDITGEGIYFVKFTIDTFNEQTHILATEKTSNPKFDAEPKKGKLVDLDPLLAHYRKEEGLTMKIDHDTKMSDIADMRPFDFMDELVDDKLEWNNPITYEKIKKYYPTFKELRNAIYDQFFSHRSYVKKSGKLFGFPVEIFLIDYDPLIKEMGVPLEYLYNTPPKTSLSYGDQKKNTIAEYRASIEENPNFITELERYEASIKENKDKYDPDIEKKYWTSLETEYIKEPYTGVFARTPMFELNQLNLLQGYDVDWTIAHESGTWWYETSGRVLDKKSILMFLPLMGKYTVTCVIRDNTGFPRITQKKLYIEVEDELSEITAIGTFIETNLLGALENLQIEDIENLSFNVNGYCPVTTTIDDCKYIDFNDLSYSKYLKQDYLQAYFKNFPIESIDDKNNRITIKGLDFFIDYIQYFKHRNKNTILVYKNSDVPAINRMELTEARINTIKVPGLQPFKVGEKLHVYKYLKTNNFRIGNDSTITLDNLENEYFDIFQTGDTFTLFQDWKGLGSNVEYKYYEQQYKILDIEKDYINNIIKLKIEDDGSLLYVPSYEEVNHNSEFKFIKYRWNKLEIKADDYLFRIKQVIQDEVNNTTTCVVDNSEHHIQELERKNLTHYKVDYGVYNGDYYFDLKGTDIYPDELRQNTIVQLDDNVENITTTFNLYYSDFDIKQAIRLGKTNRIKVDSLADFSMNELKNQTFQTLNFHETPNLGFKIFDFVDGGKIWFNDVLFQIDLGMPDLSYLNYVDLNAYYQDWKWTRLTQLLNSDKRDPIRKFVYYNVGNEYIMAVAKINDPDSLISLKYSDSVKGSSDSYPKTSFIDNKWIFFKGDNNPMDKNYLSAVWDENGGMFNNLEGDEEKVVPYFPALSSTWKLSDTFVKYKNFKAKVGTPIFFRYNDKKRNILTWEWEIWNENSDKLMCRSNTDFISWIFKDTGKYSIVLKFKDESNLIRIVKKLSFFEIVENDYFILEIGNI